MSDYKIEKDVPIPQGKYPFAQMKVGESFAFKEKEAATVSNTISREHAKNTGRRFMRRKLRVWRIE